MSWKSRSETTPREEPRVRASAMEVFRLLPRTNCGACGEKTCMAFAAKLASDEARLEECTPLDASAREQLRRKLS